MPAYWGGKRSTGSPDEWTEDTAKAYIQEHYDELCEHPEHEHRFNV